MAFPKKNIKTLVNSGYPIVWLISHDESYVERAISSIGQEVFGDDFKIVNWTSASGKSDDISSSLDQTFQSLEKGFILVKDLHFYFKDPKVVRVLKDFYNKNSGRLGKHLFIISSDLTLPKDLEKEVTIVDIPLPDFDEKEIIDTFPWKTI